MPPAPVTPRSSLEGYNCPREAYDEVFAAPGRPRPMWGEFLEALGEIPPEEMNQRTLRAERMLQENGVTFNVFRDPAGPVRPWRLDLLPVIVGNDEWTWLERALHQRATLLDALVRDIYGEQCLLREGLLPAEIVFAHSGFHRSFHGMHAGSPFDAEAARTSGATRRSITLYAAELARDPQGRWMGMADRVEYPAGYGFALENRIVASRTIPQAAHLEGIRRLAPFFMHLQDVLKMSARSRSDNPRIVVLSPGPTHPYYFEDVYLARYLGYALVEGSDLAVRDERVYVKTLAGLLQVDVILARGPERGLDPLELGGASTHGVPGLLQSIRQGHVAVVNQPGCGVAESPVFMPFLPALCRRLLGEDLALPSIATWWFGDEASRRMVFDRFADFVIKPAFLPSGSEEFFPHRQTAQQNAELKARIEARPYAFVAQDLIRRSGAPVWRDAQVRCGHVAWRVFSAAAEDRYRLMPGGLIRVNPTLGPMELSISAGEGSKDLWILADEPVEQVSLLASDERPAALRRTSALFPSRVADDLYWLGISLDRADFLARLLRAVGERLAAESHPYSLDTQVLVRALAENGQIEPGYAMDGFDEQMPELETSLPKHVFDAAEARGISQAVSDTLKFASRVRDYISPDTWKKIFQAATAFVPAEAAPQDLAAMYTAVDTMIAEVASISGLFHDGMIRGPAWRFLDLGRRMERARNVAGLLRSVIASRRSGERVVLRSLLEVLDCRMTYRSRYLDNVQQNAVMDLFVTDDTNPRSVMSQLLAIEQHLQALPREAGAPLLLEEERLSASASHALRMVSHEQLAQPGAKDVDQVLGRVEKLIAQLVDTINRKYLVHSGAPRQITDERGLAT